MKITVNKPTEIEVETMTINIKVRDEFSCTFYDHRGGVVREYNGYVPGFMPGDHYGDYLELEINLETGKILNWRHQDAVRSGVENIINGDDD